MIDNNKIEFSEIENVLGRDGSYSKTIKDYEYRDEQIELSQKITEALNNQKILLAEAGTGVGKSMAYLVPALKYALANGPVIISTNTINLQSQLLKKDIPDLTFVLPEDEFKVLLVKGRNNYVCWSMVDEAVGSLLLGNTPEMKKLLKWIKKTKTGEYQDLDFSFPDWGEVASNTHTCKREQCPYKERGECFYYKMQKQIPYADIIITNHSLFFSDLCAKENDSYAGILPDNYSAVIFDEAHHIEDNAGKVYGYDLSSYSVPLLIKRLKSRNNMGVDGELLKQLKTLNDALFEPIAKNFSGDYFLDDVYKVLGEATLKETAKKIMAITDAVTEDLENTKRDVEKDEKKICEWLISMALEIRVALEEIFFNKRQEEFFSWGETRPKDKYSNCTLHSTPFDVADILHTQLFSMGMPIIMTSATLSTSNKENAFDYIKNRLGLNDEEDLETINLGSPFDFMNNSFLYVPKDLPAPNKGEEYINKITEIIGELIDYAKGNAFVLFTSYQMMTEVYDRLLLNLKYSILRQGEMSNEELLKIFKQRDDTVLFGVNSFWEGIDVKGSRLSMVIIDKIPFPMPTSPLVKSKCDLIEKNMGNSFKEYFVPTACIRLKQGFGRLIRTKTDRGVVAILDSRIHTKFYRRDILNAIPRCKGTTKLEKIKEFMEKV